MEGGSFLFPPHQQHTESAHIESTHSEAPHSDDPVVRVRGRGVPLSELTGDDINQMTEAEADEYRNVYKSLYPDEVSGE